MSVSYSLEPGALSATERARLAERLARLAERSKAAPSGEGGGFLGVEGEEDAATVPLPAPFFHAIVQALTDVAEGHAVSVAAVEEELTTSEAADLLNVSRPYLTQLLKKGVIPHRRVGTHRRVLRRDVLAHKENMRVEAEEALQELADQAQELGLGYE